MPLLSVHDQLPIRSGGTAQELAILQRNRRHLIAGTREQVRERLRALRRQSGADEFVILTITHDFQARLRSHASLAQAVDLKPRASAA